MKNRILFIDTETGGIDNNTTSLLSIAFAVWEDGAILYNEHFYVKHKIYYVTATALEINRLDITQIDANGVYEDEIVSKFLDLKRDFFPDELITIAGHNVQFDIGFIKRLFDNCNAPFGTIFSHRSIDTSSILKYLYLSGKLSEDLSSSSSAFQFFKIHIKNRHSALDDCIATVKLFDKLISLNC